MFFPKKSCSGFALAKISSLTTVGWIAMTSFAWAQPDWTKIKLASAISVIRSDTWPTILLIIKSPVLEVFLRHDYMAEKVAFLDCTYFKKLVVSNFQSSYIEIKELCQL